VGVDAHVPPASFFYVAALRGGKYRKQYLAFLDDYAESFDGPGAFARHLGVIDQEDLRAATKEYLSHIKPVKTKWPVAIHRRIAAGAPTGPPAWRSRADPRPAARANAPEKRT